MKSFIKRGMSTVLALIMALSTGVPAFAEDGFIGLAPLEEPEEEIFEETEYIEEETELLNASAEKNLEEIIRPQIEAYAKSIDQKDANKKAQDVIISHGMRGKGKKLSVGESHALTATLINSELLKECLSKTLEELIIESNNLGVDELYSLENCMWKIETSDCFYVHIYDYNAKRVPPEVNGWCRPADYIKIYNRNVSKSNAYDKTLDTIVGQMLADVDIKIKENYGDKVIYDVSILITDTFDFDTENGSTLENLLGFIGLLLFNPFEWEAKCSFQIEIPNDCEHSYESIVTKPTCTEKGTATHTCALCGYSYTEEIAAGSHSLGEWSVYAKPTVGKAGEERRTCAGCDYYESKEIAAYRYGDVNCDGKVNTIDANYVRRYSAGLLTLDERQKLAADVDGNGTINVLDSAFIRRHTVKLINIFPVEEVAE